MAAAKKIKAYRVRVVSEVVVFATNAEDAKKRGAGLMWTLRGLDHDGVAKNAGYLEDATGTSARLDPKENVADWGFEMDDVPADDGEPFVPFYQRNTGA